MEAQFIPANQLTFDTVQADSLRLQKLVKDEKNNNICFNLENVTHCDSAGLALLIEAKRLCQHYKKTLEIKGAPAAIFALAEFCGVDFALGFTK